MMDRPEERVAIHNRLSKCGMEIEHSRTYWKHVIESPGRVDPELALREYWFGARSLPRIKTLLAELRHRFNDFPMCLPVLAGWREMSPEVRRMICHWHLQLDDPLYRRFTGEFLVERRNSQRMDVSRDQVTRWVEQNCDGRWGVASCVQFARKLLSAAYSAGLVTTNRDPRPIRFPAVEDLALTYILYLLREVRFQGTLLENPYLASIGLSDVALERRLKRLDALRFRRQGELIDFGWQYSSLIDWSRATVCAPERMPLRGAS